MTFLNSYAYKFNQLTKKTQIFLKFLTTLLVIICMFIPSGCGGSSSKFSKLLSFSVAAIPKNLDPQTACAPDEISIINNTFTGLYKRNLNGTFSLAAASDVYTNDDKTRYTFTIKNNIFWKFNSNQKNLNEKFNRQVTAADFEFALKRLLNPLTNSPFAKNYYFIKNAKQIHEGSLNLNSLGVYTENDKLILELEHPVPNLEELFSMSPTMPCNENFFHFTNGCYGLNINSILCNGIFYVHLWMQGQKDQKLRLRINDKNPFSVNTKIIGVNISQRPQKDALKLIKKNEIDSAFFNTFSMNDTDLNSLSENNRVLTFQNSTSGIIFNKNNVMFSNEKIRKALALSINRDEIKNVINGQKMSIAYNILPNSMQIAGQNFRELNYQQNSCPEYDPQYAKELFTAGLNEIQAASENNNNKNKNSKKSKKKSNKINSNSFSILTNEHYYNIVNSILQNWQKDLNLYLKIVLCDDETYFKNLKNGNFDCAITNIDNDFDSPVCMLSRFLPNSPFSNTNVTSSTLKSIIDDAVSCGSLQDAAQTLFKAEQTILDSGCFIPICHPIEQFVHSKKFDNICLVPSCKQLYFEFTQPVKK